MNRVNLGKGSFMGLIVMGETDKEALQLALAA